MTVAPLFGLKVAHTWAEIDRTTLNDFDRADGEGDLYVDGVKVTSGNALRAHAVDGGVHRIKAVCSALEFRTQEFTVTVDGEGVMLGCWDFESMAACERNR